MAVTDSSVTSRTVAQHIESVTLHSVSACTIRRRLPQRGLFARRPLFGLPFTQNRKKLSSLTSHASVCNTTIVEFESGDAMER
ncbi:uncharacterized protein TNCV_3772771 [Trichonephila clavipes]|nr:uncharacterized protein TNCV_3772771 [Trichonephila clavipes]